MSGLQIVLVRKRKLLIRGGAVLALGLAGLLAILPRADAHDAAHQTVSVSDPIRVLLAPQPVSGRHFATLYPLTHS